MYVCIQLKKPRPRRPLLSTDACVAMKVEWKGSAVTGASSLKAFNAWRFNGLFYIVAEILYMCPVALLAAGERPAMLLTVY